MINGSTRPLQHVLNQLRKSCRLYVSHWLSGCAPLRWGGWCNQIFGRALESPCQKWRSLSGMSVFVLSDRPVRHHCLRHSAGIQTGMCSNVCEDVLTYDHHENLHVTKAALSGPRQIIWGGLFSQCGSVGPNCQSDILAARGQRVTTLHSNAVRNYQT